MYHETQISFCIRRSVCTDCSDRSHPSHIGFVAGNRIHVHLCCYYRAIGVFVYWLTKSTDIESDNRHYFCPVPDPFSNPLPPLLPLCPAPAHVTPPTEPTDPPNIAAGRVKRVRERNHHPCVRVCVCVHTETRVTFRGKRREGAHNTENERTQRSSFQGGLWELVAAVDSRLSKQSKCLYTRVYIYMYMYVCVGADVCLIIVEIVHRADFPS